MQYTELTTRKGKVESETAAHWTPKGQVGPTGTKELLQSFRSYTSNLTVGVMRLQQYHISMISVLFTVSLFTGSQTVGGVFLDTPFLFIG